jgi:hypothetical protein
MGRVTVAPDGNLPGALDRLYAAVAGLVDEVKEMREGAVLVAPSLYEQLVEAVPGQFLGRSGLAHSQPPLWVDAVDLLAEIDTNVRVWYPDVSVGTVRRLRLLARYGWRPQDTELITGYGRQLESWAVSVQSLLNPAAVKQLSAPCPACNATSAYRRDSAGERVRVPALQIVTEIGCTCLVCRHTWGPELYLHLARVLGFRAPTGVLE